MATPSALPSNHIHIKLHRLPPARFTYPMRSKRLFRLAAIALSLSFILLGAVSLWSPAGLSVDPSTSLGISINARRQNGTLHKIVASLSTFPGRMDQLRPAIASIFAQSLKPDLVYVHIPYKIERFNLSIDEDGLKKMMASMSDTFGPSLQFRRGKDYGPATKLLGTLSIEKDPETLVFTVDDDTEYHPDTLLMLYQAYLDHSTHFICSLCEVLSNTMFTRLINTIFPNRLFWHYYVGSGICNGWANAFKGILYRISMFDTDVYDYSHVPKGCVIHDDVYLSGYLYKKGIRPWNVALPFDTVVNHHYRSSLSVGSTKNVSGVQMDCIKFFSKFE